MPRAIVAKLHAIQSEIGKLRMEGVGPDSQGSYKFLKVDTILEKLAPLLREHGVVVYPELVEIRTDRRYAQEPDLTVSPEKWSGRLPKVTENHVVIVDFHYLAVEDESELVVHIAGEASSTDDKTFNKAIRAAQKNAHIQTFSIVTGEPDLENSDQDAETRRELAGPSAGQQKIMQARGADPVQQSRSVVTPQPVDNAVDTDDDQKGKLRERMRDLQGKHGLTMQQVNFLATQATGLASRAEWFTKVAPLKKVVEAMADDTERERILNTAATGEV